MSLRVFSSDPKKRLTSKALLVFILLLGIAVVLFNSQQHQDEQDRRAGSSAALAELLNRTHHGTKNPGRRIHIVTCNDPNALDLSMARGDPPGK
jgi:hypothetical protein